MQVFSIPVGMLETNCYLLVDEETKASAIIAPGGDAGLIKARCESIGTVPEVILITHGHMDHFKDAQPIQEAYDCPIRIHKDEIAYMRSSACRNLLYYEPIFERFIALLHPEDLLDDNMKLSVGRYELETIEVPGPTDHSLCFYLRSENVLFAGDTLFRGSMGRTDLYNGRGADLARNIQQRLMVLPDEVTVFCGHGPSTTIGEERKYNPFL